MKERFGMEEAMNFFDKLEKTVSETGQGISRKAKGVQTPNATIINPI